MRAATLALLLAASGCLGMCDSMGGGSMANPSIGAGQERAMSPETHATRPSDNCGAWSATPTVLFDAENIDGSNNSTVSDSDPVGTWTDTGTQGDNATAAGAARPTAVQNCVNGLWCVSADGGDTPTAGTVADYKYMHDGTGGTAYFVANVDNADNDNFQGFFGTADVNAATAGFYVRYEDRTVVPADDRFYLVVSSGVSPSVDANGGNDSWTTQTWHYGTFRNSTSAGDDYSARVDGAEVAAGEYADAVSTANSDYALSLFSRGNDNSPLTGDIAVVALFSASHDAATIAANEAFLACRYGL